MYGSWVLWKLVKSAELINRSICHRLLFSSGTKTRQELTTLKVNRLVTLHHPMSASWYVIRFSWLCRFYITPTQRHRKWQRCVPLAFYLGSMRFAHLEAFSFERCYFRSRNEANLPSRLFQRATAHQLAIMSRSGLDHCRQMNGRPAEAARHLIADKHAIQKFYPSYYDPMLPVGVR